MAKHAKSLRLRNKIEHPGTLHPNRQTVTSLPVIRATTHSATQKNSESIYRPEDCRPDDLHDIWERMRPAY